MSKRIKKATRHTNQNEGLILRNRHRASAHSNCRRWTSVRRSRKKCWARITAATAWNIPEVSEIEVIRHFTRLSTWNYAIDLGMYPLGSCTMKYNPRVNEFVARLDGIATEHPLQPLEAFAGLP